MRRQSAPVPLGGLGFVLFGEFLDVSEERHGWGSTEMGRVGEGREVD